jgi:hypothetical protein
MDSETELAVMPPAAANPSMLLMVRTGASRSSATTSATFATGSPATYSTRHVRFGAAEATAVTTTGRSVNERPTTARCSASATAASLSTQMTKLSPAGESAGQVVKRAKL